MTRATDRDASSHDGLQIDSLTDPATLTERDDVPVSQDEMEHESADHCSTDIAGRVAVGVTNDDGQTLLLCNEEHGVALLPHGSVQPGEDWLVAARREIEAQTGVEIALDGIELLRDIDHVIAGEDGVHTSTYGLIFTATPAGGDIQDCKQSADAGSDRWYAGWFDGVPEHLDVPPGGPGDDLELILG
ncbi:hypothetical protein L593_09460 [Salinarchaeum sp. Harcht-Bsk1]|uniref:NUDIX hydrolase n=1 Tax=Salinarchaeum sp. Harcht-Bsk1 TaxID=1333523 RepID=UPI00034237D4|nr:NUDIX domain-containing protein [Salinarchaeum sp. Harcht-Bsk1]AGN01837.1 hypothetical protein L593_09460 [Salinarchaeum sp. Harcht-Bsk1]